MNHSRMEVPDTLQPDQARRILVVEDDSDMAAMLCAALEREGYQASRAATVAAALQWIERSGLPHLALVDIKLPGASGLEFCRSVQRANDLPVILITGVADADFKAEAIRSYAEDYVVKPFHLDELLARIERVLGRMGGRTPAQQLVDLGGAVSVNFVTRALSGQDARVELTPTESKLLHLLMAHEGAIVPARYLEQRVWPAQDAAEETLRVHMSRLRRKLAQVKPDCRYVRTERKLGYCFVRPLD